MGLYFVYQSRHGRADADRNGISNVHQGGLMLHAAAEKSFDRLGEARKRRFSDVDYQDASEDAATAQLPC